MSACLLAAALAGALLLAPGQALAARKTPPPAVHMKLVFDTGAAAPEAPAPAPAAPGAAAPGAVSPEAGPAEPEPPPDEPPPQAGEAARGHSLWRSGPAAADPRVMAAVSIPSETTARVATVAFVVELTLPDGPERRRLTGEATGRPGETADSFDLLASRGVPCLVVLAEVRNDSQEPLSFNPQNILLVTDRPDLVAPLDDTRAWEELREAGLPADSLLPDIQKVIYDTALTLKPGQSVSRLLAYPLPKPGFRRARMDFSFFAIGPASFSFAVPMRPVPVEAPPPGARP